MKGPQNIKEPTVAEAKVQLPEGMSPEKFLEIVQSYEEKRVKNSARNKARRQALNDITKKYKAEYDALVKKYTPKAAA